ncbi:hypothetical protein SAMN04487969_110105 [Paenibacillus algorifonticola]|uniref:Uncharacterized protein n=1 Tax=Paenibacillus algorifonticola TaxID=684063 RepID=A0A1I2EXD3_9BACL|nr:hypothetical protein [Paenibacillus algorifonticola]SFE97277.1 hypothetical protein SAMN04487969_110105 [Paenibacillus algorifonticola]
MESKLKTTIALYGEINVKGDELWGWYQTALKMNEDFGFPSTHLGVIGEVFKSGKLTTLKRTEQKLKKSLSEGDELEIISVYSLPKEFTQAAFDYNTFICINKSQDNQFVAISIPSENYLSINVNEIIRTLGVFIKCDNVEIFELSALESPFIYASRVNPASDFKSLKIIEKMKF